MAVAAMSPENISDASDVWRPDKSSNVAVRITVTYREIGAGPETAEVTWESVVPLGGNLVNVLKVMLDRGGES